MSLIMILWLSAGMFATVMRPKMIWQESNRNYRLCLLLICAPMGLVANVLTSAILGLALFAKGQVASYNGIDPSDAFKETNQK